MVAARVSRLALTMTPGIRNRRLVNEYEQIVQTLDARKQPGPIQHRAGSADKAVAILR